MPTKILMVCLGNICRSPLAEGILASKLDPEKFIVDSAGTGSWHVGKSPDERSVAVAKKNKISIAHQRGKHFSPKDFDLYDYIYVMDSSNYDDVMQLAPSTEHQAKVKMILNELFPGENVDVPDPYYGLSNGFEMVFNMLNEVCDIIADKLKKQHS
nr:low molecular weight protein-tyrosine-phosphatase [uncultured Flavobacterium sp.]